MIVTGAPDRKVRHLPPPPKGFDPFAASNEELARHALPLRPDPRTQPGMAALWERLADRYRNFEFLQPDYDIADAGEAAVATPFLGLAPIDSCGYELGTRADPFTALFITWTVPNLHYTESPLGVNHFRTFVGLGFLDVHVEMTVDKSHNVDSRIWLQGVGYAALAVRPGDLLSCSMCLQTNTAGTATYFLANETTSQAVSHLLDTGYPPATMVNAGVTRSWTLPQPFPPLARFGAVYFDEISAYSMSGFHSLTSGQAVTMVDQHGKVLARPVRLNDSTFRVDFVSA